jgi:hypothetical protein
MDEGGLQTNNEPAKVVATKYRRNTQHVISEEKGVSISLVACCNAEGSSTITSVLIKTGK